MYTRIRKALRAHRAFVVYIIFGILTTLVNYAVYYPLYNLAELSAALSNAIAWFVAVLVAFVTNKPFVFKSCDWSAKTTIPEILKFFGCRIGSGIAETGIILLTVDLLSWNGNIMKILTGILVVLLNYLGSKKVVFSKRNSEN